MRLRAPLILMLVLGLTCLSGVRAQVNTSSKGGSIIGRVTAANKGVAGVTVTVTRSGDALSGGGLTLKATTDAEGRFRISNLPPGTYYVWPFVPSFVVAEATGVYPQGKNVAVEEGETAEEISFTLIPGAVITGKVTDSASRAVVDERVRILPVDPKLARLVSSVYPNINDIRTDDRGIYRAYGLPAGKYKLYVGDPQFGAFTSTSGRRFYQQTFHPDVTDEAKAELVEIGEGSEATNVDIKVARAMTGFSASGRFVHAENGQPAPNIRFGLTVLSDTTTSRGYLSLRSASTSDGLFRIDNLPPGRYAISVLAVYESGYYGASESIVISDSDVSEVEVKVHRGSMISGNVVLEGINDRAIWARLSRVRLETISWAEGNSIGTVNHASVNADGSFQIGPLQPGNATIRLVAPDRNVTPEFATLSIDLNGVDKSRGIQVTAGEDVSGVRIVAGYGTGIIRGTVRVEGGTLPTGAYLDAAFSRAGSQLTIGHTPVDARGRFVFDHVPPGNYEVGVNAYLQGKRVSARQSVVASNGVITDISITLNLNPGPTPRP